jgi:hypothetical protein
MTGIRIPASIAPARRWAGHDDRGWAQGRAARSAADRRPGSPLAGQAQEHPLCVAQPRARTSGDPGRQPLCATGAARSNGGSTSRPIHGRNGAGRHVMIPSRRRFINGGSPRYRWRSPGRSSPIWTRTKNLPVNSRLLCQLSYGGSRSRQAWATGTRVHDAVVGQHSGYRRGASAPSGVTPAGADTREHGFCAFGSHDRGVGGTMNGYARTDDALSPFA